MASKMSCSDREIVHLQEVSTDEVDGITKPRNSKLKEKESRPNGFSARFFEWLADLLISEDKDKQEYLKNYNCIPPPLFILCISLAEVITFIYYAAKVERKQWLTLAHSLQDSVLVYDPYHREQIWRFVSYIFLHAGIEHILGNLLLQILIGVLLEMVHNGVRVGIVYMSGVLAGSLASSLFDPYLRLVGASGGVYALLGGFFAHIVMNWNKIALNGLHLFVVIFIVLFDVAFSIYRRLIAVTRHGPPQVSLVAHVAGGLAGITIGYVVFSNYNKSLINDPKWWACLISYAACCAVAVFWNLFLTPVGTVM